MDELKPCREEFERHIAGDEPKRILFKRGGSVFAEHVPEEQYTDGGIQRKWLDWQAAWAAAWNRRPSAPLHSPVNDAERASPAQTSVSMPMGLSTQQEESDQFNRPPAR